MNQEQAMRTYELTFIIDPIDDATIDRLAAEGIDWSQTGRLQFAHVDETSVSCADAVKTALGNLQSLGVRASRLRLDLVSSSEIAARTGVSRPAVTKWTKETSGSQAFPIEFDWSTTGPIWVWADVNDWLKTTGKAGYDEVCSPSLAEVEQANRWIADNASTFASI